MSQTLDVVIGEGGRIEIPETEFAPGTSVIGTIVPKTMPSPPLSPDERTALFEKMWELSDKAIAEGMETWDIDRINAELGRR